MADSVISVHLTELGQDPSSEADYLLDANMGAREVTRRVIDRIGEAISGSRAGKVRVRVDSSTGAAAAGTITCVVASATAGDVLGITVPGFPTYKLLAVNGAADHAAGEYDMSVASNALLALELFTTVNAMPGLNKVVTPTTSIGTVTLTAKEPGSLGNSIVFTKELTTGAAHVLTQPTGGIDGGDAASATCTFNSDTNAIVADDTITIGKTVLTYKASPSGQSELAIANVDADDAAALVVAVNAHTDLRGIVSAAAVAGVVTLTFLGDPRVGEHLGVSRAETNAGAITWSAATLSSGATQTYVADTRSFDFGAS